MKTSSPVRGDTRPRLRIWTGHYPAWTTRVGQRDWSTAMQRRARTPEMMVDMAEVDDAATGIKLEPR
ncbi:hypothetical protein KIF59_19745 [Enterobacter cloacae subsp. cloacae]|nr:hypothetical protein [Enterobacter cloacae subsp. cloacae]